MDVYWAESALAPFLFMISMIALGAGFINFLFVGALVWQRYIHHAIPEGRLAPTSMVGIAPTAIVVIFIIKFIQAVEASHGNLFGISFMSVFPVLKITASVLWGFSFWWLIVVAVLFVHYITIKDHPLSFGWWGYTFPLEAVTVSTGLLAKCVATQLLHPLLIGLNALVVIVWIVVVFATVKWLVSGAFFEAEH